MSGHRVRTRMPRKRARLRRVVRAMLDAGIRAAHAGDAVRRSVKLDGRTLSIDGRRVAGGKGPWHVLALGKAACSMAEALVETGGDRVAGGVIATKVGHGRPVEPLRVYEGGHPLPDAGSERAGRAVLDYARTQVDGGDLVWVAISGGSSAVCCAPLNGVSLEEKRRATDLLMRAGLPIEGVNLVRRHLSAIKGGGLAAALGKHRVYTLAVSDVIGNDPGTIGSGPTVPQAVDYPGVIDALREASLWGNLPTAARSLFKRGARGEVPPIPAPGATAYRRHRFYLIAHSGTAVDAATRAAAEAGFRPIVLSTSIGGETRDVAAMHAAIAREACETGRPGPPPLAVISGGETVVSLGRSTGKGGRAQEFVAAFLAAWGALRWPMAVGCVGTDGTDGPTDAAGAIGDDTSVVRADVMGLRDVYDVLDAHNAYPWFHRMGDLIRTGPTDTNVMDLRIVLVDS